MNDDFGHVVSLFFLAASIGGLVFPYRIQTFALKQRASFWGFSTPFLGWMGTRGYIWMLRVLGTLALIGAIFIEIVILLGRMPHP
jgi:hypothetical protein